MRKAYIIHGWGAVPQSNWFDWLRLKLEERKVKTVVPRLPNTENPQLEEWLNEMEKIIEPGGETVLIGHSLGAIAILRYLELLREGYNVKGALLVSGFAEPLGIKEIENFLTPPIDFKKIKRKARKFVVINSDNDSYVPLELGEDIKNQLKAEFIIFQKSGHIQEREQPFILEKAMEVFNLISR